MIGGQRDLFGVSGRLYKRNVLFFDAQTESLWSQLLSQAVTGPLAGSRLSVLPADNTTWKAWKEQHSGTLVLSFETGHFRDYNQDPYADFPIRRLPALFVAAGSQEKIYPFSELKKSGSPIIDRLGGTEVKIVYDTKTQTARVANADSASVTFFVAFVDDLKVFYPEGEVFRAPRR